jgi:signal transduction histidine kinase
MRGEEGQMRQGQGAEILILLALLSLSVAAVVGAEDRVVRVGFPIVPAIYGIDKDGKRVGYFADLQEILAARLGWKLEYVNAPWEKCLTLLDSGEIDLLGYVSRDSAGTRLFDFSTEGVIAGWSSILLQASMSFARIDDLQGKTVALVRGRNETSEFLRFVRAANLTIIPVYAEGAVDQIGLFTAKKAEAIVLSSNLMTVMLKSGDFVDTHIVLAPQAYGFAVKSRTNEDILHAIDLSLAEIKSSNPEILARLKVTYLDPPARYEIPLWIRILLVSLLTATLIGAAFVLLLRHQVRRQTASLTWQRDQLTSLSEKAQKVNEELEAFSYSVSHDLRAPLRAIDGYSHILTEDYGDRLDGEGRRLCSVISASAVDMGRLIDDLLAFSRLSRAEVSRSSVDMATLARSIFFEVTTPELRERIDFSLGPVPSAMVDPNLFRQVWANLLSNAVKFSSKKVRAAVEVSSETIDGGVVYSVRDNGAGFDMRYADKLFGVFQRLHSAREFEGTGVGLANVQRIVQRHGGRVWAEGEPGKGATFHFTTGKGE